MKTDDYVKIVDTHGDYRYGYIAETHDKGCILVISLFDEGESKAEYDAAYNAWVGHASIDYIAVLTDIEKHLVPLLAAGGSTKEIAEEMGISPVTVRAHLRTLRIKLHLDNKVQLRAFSPALAKMISSSSKNEDG